LSVVKPGGWVFFIVVSICLAVSAFYELTEWCAAVSLGQAADAFLGTQGDPWDTQWDMLTALIGATIALVTLGKLHDRTLREKP
jgi:putative membrane protein